MKKLFFIIFMLYFSLAQGEVISIPNPNTGFFYPKDDTQTIYFQNENSKAVLIFLPGGEGSFGTSPDKPHLERFFMLTPIAKGSTDIKMDFVFMDSPYILSPMNTKSNLGIRSTKDHLDRIKSVIKFYSQKTNKPVWLIGHSNGTYSLSSFLNQLSENQKLIGGAIFSSGRSETSVSGKFNIPILIIHHKNDPCPYTTYSSAQSLHETLVQSNNDKTEFVTITSGFNSGEACFAGSSHHMFSGSYEDYNNSIINFIKSR
jgi:pimeloyl-ACP methyl ester carboxylesterase